MKSLHFTCRNLWTNCHTWHMKIFLFHIWKTWPWYSYKGYGILYISHAKIWVPVFLIKHGILYISHLIPDHRLSTWNMKYSLYYLWQFLLKFFYVKYWNLCISHLKNWGPTSPHEIWNSIYSLYFIWATVFQLLKHLCSLFVFLSLYVERVCVYTHVLVLPPFLCVGVFPDHSRHTHEGDRTWDVEQLEEEAQVIHRRGENGPCISSVALSRAGMRKEWPMTTQDSGSTNLEWYQET